MPTRSPVLPTCAGLRVALHALQGVGSGVIGVARDGMTAVAAWYPAVVSPAPFECGGQQLRRRGAKIRRRSIEIWEGKNATRTATTVRCIESPVRESVIFVHEYAAIIELGAADAAFRQLCAITYAARATAIRLRRRAKYSQSRARRHRCVLDHLASTSARRRLSRAASNAASFPHAIRARLWWCRCG